MFFFLTSVLGIFILTAPDSHSQTKHEYDSLTILLEKVSIDDQKYRLGWDSIISKHGLNSPEFIELISKMNKQDSANMIIVGGILDKYGWLGSKQISKEANETLFLVIQHAPLSVQLNYLPVLKQAVKEKKAKPSEYAMLVDRTNMYQGKFQIYGSQMNYDSRGKILIYPIADEPNVNRRRKSVGLPPMEEYVKLADSSFDYKLPKLDAYKNKIVIRGTIIAKDDNKALENVSITTENGIEVNVFDQSGFFQIALPKSSHTRKLHFRKEGYHPLSVEVEVDKKEVREVNVVLEKT